MDKFNSFEDLAAIRNRLTDEEGKHPSKKFDTPPEQENSIPESKLNGLANRLEAISARLPRISPKLIRHHAPDLYEEIKTLFPAKYKESRVKQVDWRAFESQLPEKVKRKWATVENLSFEDCLNRIEILLKTFDFDKETFNPEWIEKKNRKVSRKLFSLLPRKAENEVNWQPFLAQLPEEWQKRWTKIERTIVPIEDCLQRILKILDNTEPKPKKIGPAWIKDHDVSVYSRLVDSLPRKKNGAIDWGEFTDQLPEKWQALWSARSNYGIYGAENSEYKDTGELKEFVEKYQDKLYLLPYFAYTNTKEEKDTGNQIVSQIIKFAQNGNIEAREMLQKDLRLVCEEWSQEHPELKSLQLASDELDKQITSCIYNYTQKGNFFDYLFTTLKFSSKDLPRVFNVRPR